MENPSEPRLGFNEGFKEYNAVYEWIYVEVDETLPMLEALKDKRDIESKIA